jgi:hypothetical protein
MLDFFQEVDETGIIEQHIQRVLKLEDSKAKEVLKTYRGIRGDLQDRLNAARSGTFTAQQLRGTLAQVEAAIAAMNDALSGDMEDAAIPTAMAGVQDLISELNKFNKKFNGAVTPINLNALVIAQDASSLLINRMDSSLASYGQALRSQIGQGLTDAVLIGDVTTDEVAKRVGSFFAGEEWKLTRIVRTELHGVYNLGKLNGMEETQSVLTDLQKTLIHPMDARTGEDSKFAASLKLVVDIDEPFSYNWKGKERTFMVPPDRPNDRSILVPFRASWGEGRAGFLP